MRYFLLVILNLPIIFIAFTNVITQYKTGKMNVSRFRHQMILWLAVLVVLVGSFPIYNSLAGNHWSSSGDLSLLDIVVVTVIVYLIYIVNNQRRKIEQNEKMLRDLHQELSMKLSDKKAKD